MPDIIKDKTSPWRSVAIIPPHLTNSYCAANTFHQKMAMVCVADDVYVTFLCSRVCVYSACQHWNARVQVAVWKSRWPSWAPVPNKPTRVSLDVKQHSNHHPTLKRVRHFLSHFSRLPTSCCWRYRRVYVSCRRITELGGIYSFTYISFGVVALVMYIVM